MTSQDNTLARSEHPADFALRQQVWDAFTDVRDYLRQSEQIIAVHPDDLTDNLRAAITALPLTTLRETRYIRRGTLFVMHPGLLDDLAVPRDC